MMPAALPADFVKARTYRAGVPWKRMPVNRNSMMTALRSNEPPLTKSLTIKKLNPNNATMPDTR